MHIQFVDAPLELRSDLFCHPEFLRSAPRHIGSVKHIENRQYVAETARIGTSTDVWMAKFLLGGTRFRGWLKT